MLLPYRLKSVLPDEIQMALRINACSAALSNFPMMKSVASRRSEGEDAPMEISAFA